MARSGYRLGYRSFSVVGGEVEHPVGSSEQRSGSEVAGEGVTVSREGKASSWARLLFVLAAPNLTLALIVLSMQFHAALLVPIAVAPLMLRLHLAGDPPGDSEGFMKDGLGLFGLRQVQIRRLARGTSLAYERVHQASFLSWMPLIGGFLFFLVAAIVNGITGSPS